MNSGDAVGSQTGIRLCLCHQSTFSLSLICSGTKPCPGTGNVLEICNAAVLEIRRMECDLVESVVFSEYLSVIQTNSSKHTEISEPVILITGLESL